VQPTASPRRHRRRADLCGASLDKATQLNAAKLVLVSLDQTIFDNTNLSVARRQDAPILGDDLRARATRDDEGGRRSRWQRALEYQAAARAYRRLLAALQTNGMNDEADTYRYRAQLMQRRFHWRSLRFGRWSFSALLAPLAGYGYKPARAFLAHVLVIAIFIGLFLLAGLGLITFGLPPNRVSPTPLVRGAGAECGVLPRARLLPASAESRRPHRDSGGHRGGLRPLH
jgi:hypothetical protein